MAIGSLITEADINAKLAELKGKVPTVVINDLREKLMTRRDNLTYEQLEKIVQKVLETYGSQATKYEHLSKRVDELGNRLTELSLQLGRLVETLESAKFDVHEKKAEKVSQKVDEVHEKIEKLEELLEDEEKEEIPEELTEKLGELNEKVEEIAEKIEAQTAVEKLEEAQEKLEEIQAKVEAGEEIGDEEFAAVEGAVTEAPAEAELAGEVEGAEEEAVSEKVEEAEEIPLTEEVGIEEAIPEEVEGAEEASEVEEVEVLPEGLEEVETVEEAPEGTPQEEIVGEVKVVPEVTEEVSIEGVPAHEVKPEDIEKEEGGVKMAEKIQIPEDIANLLFEEEPRNFRLEKLPEDIVSTMIALKWLGFLIDRVGIQNLERVLEFYYEIGWISEEVLNQLLRYAKGTRPHHRDPEWKPAEKLTVQDHLISLLFIERLRGLKINRNVLDKLEREIKVLEKTLDEFYGI